ncbi:hypothetical protein AYO20_01026 [Fonsecaea nubica]|uniref:F-box domain-containing protein n=1 Tax=Fonsecaea nubica TaxID=856822 RepID=A0A178DBS4_9EURO|nr:hypothetical protein AYO20_01026 [Fonsecaea nubica]OAL39629.1 hypothetical protein AYO20_01026 [Fonsecaea nubica]
MDMNLSMQTRAVPSSNDTGIHDVGDITNSSRLGVYQHLPNEILLQIILNLIPRGGLCISNHPDHNSDFATIASLLRVNRAIHDEMLRRIFSLPLHVRILSGGHCRCLFGTPPFPKTRLGRVTVLPLRRFSEVVVTFVPQVLTAPCGNRIQTPWPVDSLTGERGARKFRLDIRCIARQSDGVAEAMVRHPDVRSGASSRFRFRFDGSKGVDEANRLREIPLWEIEPLQMTLDKWRRVATPVGTVPLHQIDMPESLVTGVVAVFKLHEGRLTSVRPLDECSNAVARCWKGFWLGFRFELPLHIDERPWRSRLFNRRFIITTRSRTGASGDEPQLEAEAFVQGTLSF